MHYPGWVCWVHRRKMWHNRVRMKRLTVLILFTFVGSGTFFAQTPDLATRLRVGGTRLRVAQSGRVISAMQ